ncbi:MAG: VWA domain-containing protein, partial [Candidatus Zixiibacteriota bacterium]
MGSHLPEPARGVDFLRRFAEKADGNSPATIRYLRETIDEFSKRSTSFEEIFLDFCITNYTHTLDLTPLSGKYPDLDYPKRDYPTRYTYYDESAAGGGTSYGSVTKKSVASWDKEYSGSVERWATQYLEIDVTLLDLKGCEVIGLKGQADSGKELGWALIGMSSGRVLDIYRFTGNTFYSAFLNDQTKKYDKLALVVVGLNSESKFNYKFGSGNLKPKIMLPTQTRVARVGEKNNPQRFQIRFHLDGPKVLTPAGSGPPSVRGVDASKVEVTLVGKKSYSATVINSSYVDGEYWLVIGAPTITDPTEGDLFDLKVCLCKDVSGACKVKASSPKSVIYGKFQRNQMIVLDRSGSMKWYGGVKFDAAKNAGRLAVEAGGESDRMGIVTFWGWRDKSRQCEVEATNRSGLIQVGINRNVLINSIEGITIGGKKDGWTSIGDGLTLAAKHLLANQKLHKYDEDAILLLSDGLPNRRLYWEKDNSGCSGAPQVSMQFSSNGPYADFKIYTEGFGPDADMGLLTRMAKATGGFAYSVRADKRHCPLSDPLCLEIPNRLAESFRRIQEDFLGLDRFYYGVFDLAPSKTPKVVEIPIP